MSAALKKLLASQALANAITGSSGEDILRAYTVQKEGDADLMVHEDDRKDLVADLIADLSYLGKPLGQLEGYIVLGAALEEFCEANGFDFADLVRRGIGNATAELDEGGSIPGVSSRA
jgi:hypothetical protein